MCQSSFQDWFRSTHGQVVPSETYLRMGNLVLDTICCLGMTFIRNGTFEE